MRQSDLRFLKLLYRVSSDLLGPINPSFRAISGRLKFTVRRHKFNQDSLSLEGGGAVHTRGFSVSGEGGGGLYTHGENVIVVGRACPIPCTEGGRTSPSVTE